MAVVSLTDHPRVFRARTTASLASSSRIFVVVDAACIIIDIHTFPAPTVYTHTYMYVDRKIVCTSVILLLLLSLSWKTFEACAVVVWRLPCISSKWLIWRETKYVTRYILNYLAFFCNRFGAVSQKLSLTANHYFRTECRINRCISRMHFIIRIKKVEVHSYGYPEKGQ